MDLLWVLPLMVNLSWLRQRPYWVVVDCDLRGRDCSRAHLGRTSRREDGIAIFARGSPSRRSGFPGRVSG